MRVVIVVGIRPHFVKLAPLLPRLAVDHEVLVVNTGQHFDHELSQGFLDEFGLPAPDRSLAMGSGTQVTQTSRAMQLLEAEYDDLRPDVVVVIGDSNTTLAGALTAVKMGIHVVHIEAGVRSFDMTLPEEVNRRLIDSVARLHLSGTERGVQNLAAEGHAETTTLVGDLLLDCIDWQRSSIEAAADRWRTEIPHLAKSAVFTFHRSGTVRDPAALRAITDGILGLAMPTVCVLHPATRRALEEADLLDALRAGGVRLLGAQGHGDILGLVSAADRVFTDSNGVQRESLLLGTPCFVLRETTECAETVELGAGELIGTDTAKIVAAGGRALSMPDRAQVWDRFGGGKAAERIASALSELT